MVHVLDACNSAIRGTWRSLTLLLDTACHAVEVVEGPQLDILIVSEDEQDIRLRRRLHQRCCESAKRDKRPAWVHREGWDAELQVVNTWDTTGIAGTYYIRTPTINSSSGYREAGETFWTWFPTIISLLSQHVPSLLL